MKYLKMLGLAVLAAAALTALIGAGSASATVLCKTQTNPCTSRLAKGTAIEFSLKTGTSALWRETSGATIKTCTGGKIAGTLSNEGSSIETANISLSEFSWTGCTVATVTIKPGELEIHNIAGTQNGTVTMKNAEFTTNSVLAGSCTYGSSTPVDLGTLTASPTGNAVMDINALLTQTTSICCPDVVWTEEFVLTAPKETPLYVEPS